MRGKKARQFRKEAERATIGKDKETTQVVYKQLKQAYKRRV